MKERVHQPKRWFFLWYRNVKFESNKNQRLVCTSTKDHWAVYWIYHMMGDWWVFFFFKDNIIIIK